MAQSRYESDAEPTSGDGPDGNAGTGPIEYVLCFDRDYTITVNECPHDEHEQVPLSWVKHYAHDDLAVDVWATGNQHLRTEAEIPGIEEARAVWERQHGGDATDHYESEGYHSYKPSRQEGLMLIRDCYAHLDAEPVFVVVDDVNLASMSGWTYYTPWGFVECVRDNLTGLSNPMNTQYSDTSVESNSVDERVERHASVIA